VNHETKVNGELSLLIQTWRGALPLLSTPLLNDSNATDCSCQPCEIDAEHCIPTAILILGHGQKKLITMSTPGLLQACVPMSVHWMKLKLLTPFTTNEIF